MDDAELLVGWHADPDVARYWDGKTFTRDEMTSQLARPDVDMYIVEADRKPVGYLQAWFEEALPGSGGLDMFLIPSARDHALGPDAARTLAQWLLGSGGVQSLSVDPYVWNERAIRAWTKAGFRPVEVHEPDDGHAAAWLLMVLDQTV